MVTLVAVHTSLCNYFNYLLPVGWKAVLIMNHNNNIRLLCFWKVDLLLIQLLLMYLVGVWDVLGNALDRRVATDWFSDT